MEKKNEYQEKICELLDKYIEEINSKKQKLEEAITFKALYEELITLLKNEPDYLSENKIILSILFTTLYKDDIYLNKFYSLLPNLETSKEKRKELKELINKIYNDYMTNEKTISSLDSQIKRSKNLILTAKRTRYKLKYSLPITEYKYDIENIKTILNYFEIMGEISKNDFLLLINEIELYNRRILTSRNNSEQENKHLELLYNEIPNIINAGYQKHDEVEVLDERRPILDKFVKEIISYIESLDESKIIENIEKYGQYNIDDNEYNYIIIKLLDSYQEELVILYELLSDKDIFLRRQDRLEVAKNYYEKLNLYLRIRNYYESINQYEETETDDDVIEEEKNESVIEPRKLIYATSPNNNLKIRLLSDMNDIPKAYYEKTEKLLDDFKYKRKDKSIIKTLKGRINGKICTELKDDQIRIIYRQINEDTFIIIGVFIKKDDNDHKKYKEIKNRAIPTFDTPEKLQRYIELANQVEKELSEKVKKEGQNYTR